MKQSDLISVIVPVYNVEKYLGNTLESILSQTYKNLEILVIDDGSTDLSKKICDEYQERYYDIIKVFHKNNGGLADARNYGLDIAKGEYICFVDGDDLINCEMIEILYNEIKESNSEISVCTFRNINEKFELENCYKKDNYIRSKQIFNNEEALKNMVNLNSNFAPNVCNKMFKRKLFTKDSYFPKGKLYEDMIVTVKLLNKARRIVYLECDLYYYLQRKDSITKRFNKKELDHIEMSNEVLNFIRENCKHVENYFITYHVINSISVINKMIINNDLDLNIYYITKKFINDNKKNIFIDSNLSIKKKIQLYLFKMNIKIYSFIYYRFEVKNEK